MGPTFFKCFLFAKAVVGLKVNSGKLSFTIITRRPSFALFEHLIVVRKHNLFVQVWQKRNMSALHRARMHNLLAVPCKLRSNQLPVVINY